MNESSQGRHEKPLSNLYGRASTSQLMESQLALGALAITKVLEVRQETDGPQAKQLKTVPCGQTLQDKGDERSEEELSPA